jgi:cytochrome c
MGSRHFLIAALVAVASPAFAEGNADAGKRVFGKCIACHGTTEGRNGPGPSLVGVLGRPAGSVPGFNYSPALRGANITWSAEELDAFLANPREKVPNTRQPIAIPSAAERADIIAYLATLR